MSSNKDKFSIINGLLITCHVIVSNFILFISIVEAQSPDLQIKAELSGQSIIEQQRKMNEGYQDQILQGQMIVYGPNQEKRAVREFKFWQLEERNHEGSKALIKILQPADLAGTGLLSFQNKDRADDQWVYLSAFKKTSRISGSTKSRPFLGTEFSNEDFLPPDINKYTYNFIRSEPCYENVSCFIVEWIPQFTDTGYSKTLHWIRSDNYQDIKIQFFNLKGILEKEAFFEDYRLVNKKYWRAYRVKMVHMTSRNETHMVIQGMRLQVRLENTDFTQRVLER